MILQLFPLPLLSQPQLLAVSSLMFLDLHIEVMLYVMWKKKMCDSHNAANDYQFWAGQYTMVAHLELRLENISRYSKIKESI